MSQRADGKGSTRVILLGLMAAAAVAAWALPPLPQDTAYHAFADGRALGPVANAANVLSNLVFLVAGLLGLRAAVRQIELPARPAWIVAFGGIALVSVGSAWYHRAPGDDTLLWDRLPMTIGFMGLLAAVLAIPFGDRVARRVLWPAVIIGVGSVVAWRLTGDLRPYAWVQFTPLLVIGAILVLCPLPPPHRRALLSALVLYAIAKGSELADARLFAATAGVVSGHTLKHLAAGAACGALVRLTR
jgi:ceramidase